MAFDGVVMGAIAVQLAATLVPGKIEKIYQPEADELLLHISCGGGKHRLLLSAASNRARVHITEENFENPANPSAFCMLLRKYLQGGRISAISQSGSDRVLTFSIDAFNELGFSVPRKLIVECMGKHSNIIAVDCESGKILDCIKRIPENLSRYRQLLPEIGRASCRERV